MSAGVRHVRAASPAAIATVDPSPLNRSPVGDRPDADEAEILIDEITAWLDRHRVKPPVLAYLAGIIAHRKTGTHITRMLAERDFAHIGTVMTLVAACRRLPDGVPEYPTQWRANFCGLRRKIEIQSIAERRAERETARATHEQTLLAAERSPKKRATADTDAALASELQLALLARPDDAITALRRQWPDLLARLRTAATANDTRPMPMLVQLLTHALDAHEVAA